MFTVRKNLSARSGAPPNTRVNPETGVVETSMDDGVTWVPDPNNDPRQNPVYMMPPPDVPDVQCAAAAGMVENVRRVIDGAAGGTTVAAIATLLLTLLLIPGIGWMFAAMLLFASSFVAAGSAGILAAWTEAVYDDLLCAFRNNIDADGKVSWVQLEAVHDDMSLIYSNPLITDTLAGIMQMHREVGFTNAGVVYADSEADCDDCGGTCYEQVYVAGSAPSNVYFHTGEWNTGGALNSNWTPYTSLNVSINLGDTVGTCQYDSAQFDYNIIGTGTLTWYLYGMNDPSPFAGGQTELDNGTIGTGTATVDASFTPAEFYGLQLVIFSEDSDETECRVTRIQICSPNLGNAGLTSNCDNCE